MHVNHIVCDSVAFWQWYITFGTIQFLDYIICPVFFGLLNTGQWTNSKTECHWEECFVIYKIIWEHHVFILYFEVSHSLVSWIKSLHLLYCGTGGVHTIHLSAGSVFLWLWLLWITVELLQHYFYMKFVYSMSQP